MRILDRAVYVGPSLYAHFPVIRLDVDLGELENWPSGRLGPSFTDGLVAALPGLREHGCSYGKPGGFIRRLTEDGTIAVVGAMYDVGTGAVEFRETPDATEYGVLDEISRRTGIPVNTLLSRLTLLELKGYVVRLPGRRFSLVEA